MEAEDGGRGGWRQRRMEAEEDGGRGGWRRRRMEAEQDGGRGGWRRRMMEAEESMRGNTDKCIGVGNTASMHK